MNWIIRLVLWNAHRQKSTGHVAGKASASRCLDSKIEDLKAELQNLEKLANKPEQRKHEAGDVWSDNGENFTCDSLGHGVFKDGYRTLMPLGYLPLYTNAAYLGKFHEVYVEISDVREALSYEDFIGNSVLDSLNSEIFVGKTGSSKTLEALRKLNIITD